MIDAQKKDINEFEVWGSGKPKREWIYVNDVSKIILRLIKLNIKENLTVNIAQNKSYSINEIAKLIKKHLKFKGKIINNTSYPDGAPFKQLDNKKFNKIFKNFNFINFDLAVKNTVKSYKHK